MAVRSTEQPRDIRPLAAWPGRARRGRRLAGVDICLGLLLAALALVLAPGLGIVAVAALPLIGVCILSLLLARRRARRGP